MTKLQRLHAVLRHTNPPAATVPLDGRWAVGRTPGPAAATSAEDNAVVASANQYLDRLVTDGTTSGACLAVSRRGVRVSSNAVGYSGPRSIPSITHGLHGHMALKPDSIFMTASITKPVTATAALLLVQEGRIRLDDRVTDHLPEFTQGNVKIIHLLSHTSGLPDSWNGNHALRRQMAPLSDYHREQLGVGLLFRPGANVSYSSIAIDILAAIIEKVVGEPLSVFLHRTVFAPLGMNDTSLGHPPGARWARQKQREACLNIEPWRYNRAGKTVGDEEELPLGSLSFGNSDYWRELGCPSDFPLTAETVGLMTRPHTGSAVAAAASAGMERLDDGCWGLGWRINAAGSANVLGTVSSTAFGAHGSSGCMAWADPESGLVCVVLTPEPDLCYSAEFNALSDLLLQQ